MSPFQTSVLADTLPDDLLAPLVLTGGVDLQRVLAPLVDDSLQVHRHTCQGVLGDIQAQEVLPTRLKQLSMTALQVDLTFGFAVTAHKSPKLSAYWRGHRRRYVLWQRGPADDKGAR